MNKMYQMKSEVSNMAKSKRIEELTEEDRYSLSRKVDRVLAELLLDMENRKNEAAGDDRHYKLLSMTEDENAAAGETRVVMHYS